MADKKREKDRAIVNDGAGKRARYQTEIQDMMYTFGDSRNTSSDSSELLEQLVRDHMRHLTHIAAKVALKKGTIRMTIEDVAFPIRKDRAKLARLRSFLSWKEVRKKAKNSEKLHDEAAVLDSDVGSILMKPINKRKNMLSGTASILQSLKAVGQEEIHLSEEQDEEFEENKERLRIADEMTRGMSQEEYIDYSECRGASFTYKKGKKFRDWLDCGSLEAKFNDDILEILGYLAWETVGIITQTALIIKRIMEHEEEVVTSTTSTSSTSTPLNRSTIIDLNEDEPRIGSKRAWSHDEDGADSTTATASSHHAIKRRRIQPVSTFRTIHGGLFDSQLNYRHVMIDSASPILPEHIREAIRRFAPLNHSVCDWAFVQGSGF